MANIKPIIHGAAEFYQKTLQEYRLKLKQMPELSLSEFLRSAHVDKKRFMEWMKSEGYSYTKSKKGIRIIRKKATQTNMVMKKEVDNQTPTSDSENMVFNNPYYTNSDAKQYWWLNVDATIWELDKANNNETKIINRDIQFIEWISNYLIDEKHYIYVK